MEQEYLSIQWSMHVSCIGCHVLRSTTVPCPRKQLCHVRQSQRSPVFGFCLARVCCAIYFCNSHFLEKTESIVSGFCQSWNRVSCEKSRKAEKSLQLSSDPVGYRMTTTTTLNLDNHDGVNLIAKAIDQIDVE